MIIEQNKRYVQPRILDDKYNRISYDTTKDVIMDKASRGYVGVSHENREHMHAVQESPEWYVHMQGKLRVENQDGRQDYQDREFVITITSFDKETSMLILGSYVGVDLVNDYRKGFLRPDAKLICDRKVPIKRGPGGYDVQNTMAIIAGLIELCRSTAASYASIIRNDAWVYDQSGVAVDITDLTTYDLKYMTSGVEGCINWLKDKYPEVYFADPNAPIEPDDDKKKKKK